MSNAMRSQWLYPKNEANKVPGWRSDGKGLENKTVLFSSDLIDDDTMATATSTNVPSAESVKAYVDARQPIDPTLTALAGVSTAANKVPYFTGTDTAGVLDFKDEDDLASNSATAVPSQQSVKAYVDANVASATAAQVAAEAAQALAEAARDSTWTDADYYASTAAGLSGTAEGDKFRVPTADGLGWQLYSHDAGPVATAIGDPMPNKAYVDKIPVFVQPYVSPMTVLDEDTGKILSTVDASGVTNFTGVKSRYIGPMETLPQTSPFQTVDEDTGQIIAEWTADGKIRAQTIETYQAGAARLLGSIAFIPVYGQSLSYGIATGTALTIAQLYNALMFVGGRRPHEVGDDTAAYASLVPLVESYAVDPIPPASYAETPASGLCEMIRQLLMAENGLSTSDHDWAPLVVTPGQGSTAIDNLDKGSTYYGRITTAISKAYDRAQDLGKSIYSPALPWIQGERDVDVGTAPATYISKLVGLQADYEADVQTAFGTTDAVPLILPQTVSHLHYSVTDPEIAQAQLDACRNNTHIHLATVPYWLTFAPDNVHLTNASSRLMGATLGLVIKRTVIDQAEWRHFDIDVANIRQQGKVITVPLIGGNLADGGTVVIDTSSVAAVANYGFNAFDAGLSEITIDSVSISQRNVLTITTATAIPSGGRLRVGWNGTGATSGPLTGPRTNIRDNSGDTLTFGGIALHQWLPIQEIIL